MWVSAPPPPSIVVSLWERSLHLEYRRPTRERHPPTKLNLLSVYHMTAKQALRDIMEATRPAIESELRTLLSNEIQIVCGLY